MSRTSQTADTLPQFAKPLLPYLKPRQEALKIRRALTLFLKAQITFLGDSTAPHISLSAPNNIAGVKRNPPELNNGLRGQYLKALQANVTARKEYDKLAQEICSGKQDADLPNQQDLVSGQEIQTYLDLLRGRQEHGRLQIFQHYLAELNSKEAARRDYLGLTVDRNSFPVPSQDPASQTGTGNGYAESHGQDFDSILNNLERAVILAKYQLEREKSQLEKLKTREQRAEEEPNSIATLGAKTEALRCARNELVRWVEEKLVASNVDEGLAPNDPCYHRFDDNMMYSLEGPKARIREQYMAYVDSRRALLESVLATSRPAPKPTRNNPPPPKAVQKARRSIHADLSPLFSYINGNLLPLSTAQGAPTVQKSYLSTLLNKEKWAACRILDRLREESHLLPEYPTLAKQPSFKHAVSAINPRPGTTISADQNTISEIVGQAQSWAFASEVALGTTRNYIKENVDLGTEAAARAEATLKEIYEMMNQDYEDVTLGDGDEKSDGDIWASEFKAIRNRGRQARNEKRSKGPWSGLNGKVAAIGET